MSWNEYVFIVTVGVVLVGAGCAAVIVWCVYRIACLVERRKP